MPPRSTIHNVETVWGDQAGSNKKQRCRAWRTNSSPNKNVPLPPQLQITLAPLCPPFTMLRRYGGDQTGSKKRNRDAENGEQTIHQKKNVPPQKYLTSDCCDAPLSPIYNVEKVWCGQAGSNKKGIAWATLSLGGWGRGESLNQESEVSTFAG